MLQIIFRFLVGGLVVSVFASLADTLKPKSFAGLFGAAPSVALATLGLTIAVDGRSYAAVEARSMVAGAAGFLVYAILCTNVLMRSSRSALSVTSVCLFAWFATVSILFLVWLR
ncbi:MAG: DUF3147 family protein [Acidobacteria bacterium]|nr:DUF3147 family protein [Acidobacteriota bacterium]